MPETQKLQETTDAPEQAPQKPAKAEKADADQVAVELNPDFELPEGADRVSVEVGSEEPIELVKGQSVKVSGKHALLLASVPSVRRVK